MSSPSSKEQIQTESERKTILQSQETSGSISEGCVWSGSAKTIKEFNVLIENLYEGLPSGRECIKATDTKNFENTSNDLLFGEISSSNTSILFSATHLNVPACTTFYDLGMGLGKLAFQAFLLYPNLHHVLGLELSDSRFEIAVKALKKLAQSNPKRFSLSTFTVTFTKESQESEIVVYQMIERETERVLQFRKQEVTTLEKSLLNTVFAVNLNVCFLHSRVKEIEKLLLALPKGCKISWYNVHSVFPKCRETFKVLPDVTVSYLSLHQKIVEKC